MRLDRPKRNMVICGDLESKGEWCNTLPKIRTCRIAVASHTIGLEKT